MSEDNKIVKSGRTLTLEEFLEKQGDSNIDNHIENPIIIEKDQNNKWYMPKLYLNDATMWPSKPLSERKHFTDEMAFKTCVGNCCGVEGLKSACCHMYPDSIEHVLGPVTEEDIKKIIKHFKKDGVHMDRSSIVIDYEEGKVMGVNLFNDHPVFQSESSYPILRIQIIGQLYACKFLTPSTRLCSIYKNRPNMCRDFLCKFIKRNFLIRTPSHQNTYQKIE